MDNNVIWHLGASSSVENGSADKWPTDMREAAKRMALDTRWTLPPFWGLPEVYRSSYGQ